MEYMEYLKNFALKKVGSRIERLIRAGGVTFKFSNETSPIFSSVIYGVALYSLKMGTYTWNFGDIFLIVICRAISYKFKQINEHIKEFVGDSERVNQETAVEFTLKMDNDEKIKAFQETGKITCKIKQSHFLGSGNKSWLDIRDKIFVLCKLSDSLTSFVAPLVLACYACNLYLIIQRVSISDIVDNIL